jgi:hypothetical protein
MELNMNKANIEIDVACDLTDEGIWTGVYAGDNEVLSTTVDFKTIRDQHLEFCTLATTYRDKHIIPYEEPGDVSNLFEIVGALRRLADDLEYDLQNCLVFNRAEWREAGQPAGDQAKDKFYKSMEDFYAGQE